MKSKGTHNIFHKTLKYLESVHKPVSANFKETTFFITTTYFIQHMFDLLEIDGFVKSTNHVILNEVRMKNLSQLSTRFFVASLPQNDSFGSFYETIILLL
ncbi:MAG: hypothetical protein KAU06_06280 [Candidatus Marinimicrobia bacterium]|nr:hypothetical protein [Candidatus Neomarinimicrobiota bacterium]